MRGEPALSAFRLQKLADRIFEVCGVRETPAAHFVYLLEASGSPSAAGMRRLESLLHAARADSLEGQGLALVIPRMGTRSAWSSKATDIVRRCHLEEVERIERGVAFHLPGVVESHGEIPAGVRELLHDRMIQAVVPELDAAWALFAHHRPAPLRRIGLAQGGAEALADYNREMGLALSDEEIDYLARAFRGMGRDPSDAELMMFAQANSEHCRHKIFNAEFTVDGKPQKRSLFSMIRNTHARSPEGILSAYHDNSAVIAGPSGERFFTRPGSGDYAWHEESLPFQVKVETHNHPTAISPFPGAATGSGGEIRDESATGRGARPKAGLTGFSVSHLDLPGLELPWRREFGKPERIASPLEIMIEGPIGGASFNNEFGRPALAGYFRSFEAQIGGRLWGYHKPIMVAGGMGAIRESQVEKRGLVPGAKVVVLGGPAMLIGLGGGAASSMGSGQGEEQLDYASVQRGNPEMQRRCQEVIDACWALGEDNPILSVHDVGAGGLSNAIPELLHGGGCGGRLELREVPNADLGMSPMEIWCNEAQERYVMAVSADGIERFEGFCRRERCPYAILGEASEDRRLVLDDRLFDDRPVDMPLELLLGDPPGLRREARRQPVDSPPLDLDGGDLEDHLRRVLRFPAVGSKSFLVTIGDRTVGGLTARDQMVGPWQIPVADAAVTLSGFKSRSGEAMAMGERTPLAVIDGPASGRMAVAEAVTNIASAAIEKISDIRLSANWMAASGEDGQDAALFDTVHAVGMELCPELGIAIPVGKDSLSMRTLWQEGGEERRMLAPVSLIVSAFAPVADVARCLTPMLQVDGRATRLFLIDLGRGRNRLGGSVLAQANGQFGSEVPDLDEPALLSGFFRAIQALNAAGKLIAYHDRSDGGLIVSLLEMAFAAHCGLDVRPGISAADLLAFLFAEEAGAVIQVAEQDVDAVRAGFADQGLGECVHDLGAPVRAPRLRLWAGDGGRPVLEVAMTELQKDWMETSHAVQRLRDNPETADAERAAALDWSAPGLVPRLTFDPAENPAAAVIAKSMIGKGARPRVAIVREQGVNGQLEMAAAFDLAGFEAVDVHMSDLQTGLRSLSSFAGFVACGGFSYGDVLGAGQGWAKSILYSDSLRAMFADFLADTGKFALGVCNGCQMLAALAELVPGSEGWPRFIGNRSEQFEARLGLVEVEPSASLFFRGMEGARLPIAVAHGEGRADFADGPLPDQGVCLRFVDGRGRPAENYPANPNGSPGGITGLTNLDGRVTILMPHPERTLRRVNFSWAPGDWPDASPWRRMFENARLWLA